MCLVKKLNSTSWQGEQMLDSPDGGPATVRAHIFTNVNPSLFKKHFPRFDPELDGIRFSFGLDIPADMDVLIVYTRASYSIPTSLPPERTVFVAAEPDDIHPYSKGFLNQFGIVLSATDKALKTEHWRTACCTLWFAGIDFRGALSGYPEEMLKGIDWFRSVEMPAKQDRISIVTSNKSFTPYHRKRLEFIDALVKIIPDRIEFFGHGFRSVDDKKDALLPYKYHLAIENCDGPDLWTEKLADPYLCGAFPFYAGCTNAESYFPAESFHYVDLDRPEVAARQMVAMIESNHWQKVQPALDKARENILTTYNVAELFVRLSRAALAKPVSDGPRRQRLIRSERSLWPEKGAKGSFGEWAVRNLLLMIDPKAELRAAPLQRSLEALRAKRRKRRRLESEKLGNRPE
jgi:hypothetical protein